MDFETIILEKRPEDGIAILTLNRPRILNALNHKTKIELNQAAKDVEGDDSIKVLIITGAGRAFCAGQDLKETAVLPKDEGKGMIAKRWIIKGETLYDAFAFFPKPIISALHGYVCGDGFQLALLTDLRIASEDTKMAMTEINVGIPCVWGSWMISRVADPVTATEITLTGNFVDAARAEKLNLVNRVVPKDKLMSTAIEMAKELAKKPPIAMKLQKKWLNEYFKRDYDYIVKRGLEIQDQVYGAGEPQRVMKDFLDRKQRLTKKDSKT